MLFRISINEISDIYSNDGVWGDCRVAYSGSTRIDIHIFCYS